MIRRNERHIASGIRHTEKPEQIIAELDCGDHDAAVALELLTTFRDMQDHLVAHRDRAACFSANGYLESGVL